jgi:hypothetical protein
MRDVRAIVTERGAGCDGPLRRQALLCRAKRLRRTVKSCGPGAATLALRWRISSAGNGGKKGRSPGRARISRQTIARGKPGCPGCTRRFDPCARAHGVRYGCRRRPAFPAPSVRTGGNGFTKPEQDRAAGMRAHVSPPSLRAKRSNPALPHKERWIASAFALRASADSQPGVACAASVDGSSLRSSQ